MSPLASNPSRLRITVEDLCDILDRLRQLHEQLLVVLEEKERALIDVRLDDVEALRDREEQLLRKVIEEEKERLLVTEEVGDLVEHEQPVSIRVAEMLPHLEGDLSEALSARREGLRDVVLRLADQNRTNRALIEHSVDHIQIFLSRVATEESGGRYDQNGTESDSGGGPFLMDRRV